MTEEEKARLKAVKVEVTEWLANVKLSRYSVGRADKRITAYVKEVAKNPKRHNLWEQLSVRRFLRMVEKYGLDSGEIARFFYFYEHLHFPGKSGDQCYKLTPVQCFQFANIYGFWHEGRRVIREACLFVPRKFSKTTSTASIAVYDMLYGEANAEAYVGANSFDQAKKCFDVIRGCMRHLDPKGARYTVNEDRIKSRRRDRTAFCQCLTAGARTKDGLNASTVIMDEFSQARDSELLTVLTTSMGVRDNPLTVIITTASDQFNGPFYAMLQGYKSVLLGDIEDDSLFAHIFEPDVDDPEDSESTWSKVHPHLGITVNRDFYKQEWIKAQRGGADMMLAFRTKLLNVFAENQTKSWISATTATSIMKRWKVEDIKGRPLAMGAFDLSIRRDFTAFSFGMPFDHERHFYFHTDYFFPEGALSGHPNERLYRIWAEQGHLILTPGDVVDYRTVLDRILYVNKYIKLLRIGYDRYKARELVNMLKAAISSMGGNADATVIDVGQTNGNFNAPTETFEHGVYTGKIFINDNPINAYCFGNAVLSIDHMENVKPEKRSDNDKIDGVISNLMCMRLLIDHLRYVKYS